MTEKSPFTPNKAGEAFLIDPSKDSQGPGILVLHSWWGLNQWVKDFSSRLAKEGYTVLAPDMFAGVQPSSEEEGKQTLADLDADELSGLVMSSAQTLRAASADSSKPIGVVGLSMGASLGFWLSARIPDVINAVVSFYGTQAIDFDSASADYLGFYGEQDHLVSADERVSTESFIRLGGKNTDFITYADAKHWFFEAGANFNQAAADDAWDKLVPFLAERLQDS